MRPFQLLLAGLIAACTAAPPASIAHPTGSVVPATSPPLATECPPPTLPGGLDLSFLDQPVPLPAGATLAAQVIIGYGEANETDLSQQPLLASYEVVGDAPTRYADWRTVAFEAGSSDACAVRVLLDDGALDERRGDALAVEVDVDGTTLRWVAGDEGFCTFLSSGSEQSFGLECLVPPSAVQSTRFVRIWARFAWAARPIAGSELPAWAATAIGPEPTPTGTTGPGDQLVLAPLPADPFRATDSPFPGEWQLEGTSVTLGPAGWVATGAYGAIYNIDDELPDADAVLWSSADGHEWRRVLDESGVLGGPGLQQALRVVATDTAYWVVGHELLDGGDVRRQLLWRSRDGLSWQRFELGVLGGAGPDCQAAADDPACAKFLADIVAMPGGGLAAVGFAADGRPAVWRIDADGRMSEPAVLEPLDGYPGISGTALSIASDGRSLVVLAAIREPSAQPGPPRGDEPVRNIVWYSDDGGISWQVPPPEAAGFGDISNARRLIHTVSGWFALADKTLMRWDTADGTWRTVLEAPAEEYSSLRDLVGVEGMPLVAIGGGGRQPYAFSSTNGDDWRPLTIGGRTPERSRFNAVASDGHIAVVIGTVGDDAAIWLGEFR